MMGKNSDSELPPGFATPLAKTVPRKINPPCFKGTATAVAATTSTPISDQSEKCNMHDQCQGETTFSVIRGRIRPRKPTPVSAEAPSMATKEIPAVSLLPVPPLGSSIDAPLLITDEERRETKINLNPLLMLNPPPNPRLWNEYSSNIHEEVKTTISNVKSVLVFQLTSGSIKNVEDMVKCANNAFFSLDILDADYTSFYKDVKDLIAYHFDLLTIKRQREMQSFPELKTRYEDAISCAKGHKDEIFRIQDDMVLIMKKKETFERQMLEAMELIGRLKQWVDVLKQNEEALKNKKQKCVADHVIASLKVQNLHTQVEAAKDVLREIDQRENAALGGIESATRRLKSLQS